MKEYIKPSLEWKVVMSSDSMASGLEGWLTNNNLSDAGITDAVLTLGVNS